MCRSWMPCASWIRKEDVVRKGRRSDVFVQSRFCCFRLGQKVVIVRSNWVELALLERSNRTKSKKQRDRRKVPASIFIRGTQGGGVCKLEAWRSCR